MRKQLLILLALLPLVANAYDAEIDGIYYEFSYMGNGVFVANNGTNGYSGDVVIPASVTYNDKTYSVTSIGYSAFSGCTSLTSVTIPNSVTSIGSWAFSGCSGLTSIIIPNSVISIGDNAFYGCFFASSSFVNNSSLTNENNWGAVICDEETTDGLLIKDNTVVKCRFWATSVTIPNSVTSIGNSAFSGCSSLSSVTIPNSVTSIGDYAFSGCYFVSSSFINNSSLTSDNNWGANICDEETTDGLLIKDNTVVKCRKWATSVTIPNSVTSIGSSAFYGCSGLTSIIIPNGVTSIGNSAFSGCSGLTSITIPNSVTSIDNYAFSGCSSLTSVTIGSSVISIGESAFSGCSGLTSIIIPNSVTRICDGTFWGCSSLISITIGSSVTSIGNSAFRSCSSLTSVTIPNSVTSIGEFAFTECNALASLNIGKGITSIGSYAFNDCKLRNVLIKRAIPPTASNYSFSEQTFYHTTLYVPTGSWDNYAYDNKWYKFINIRETAMVEEQLSMQQAYTLMDASTFAYSVYDPVNICIGNLSSVGINEDNPNHSWQVIESGSSHYLYNVGAKKFVVASANGSFALSDTPTSINMENGDNGIIIGTQTTKQWALVTNERLSAEQAIIDGIDEIPTDFQESTTLYDLNGRQVQHPSKGIYIRNGKKVLVK